MAKSPAHAIGEQIGFLLEEATRKFIQKIIPMNEFYVDYRHTRAARGNTKEVILQDVQGNKHKLDIVIERGGSETSYGVPWAFIEVAWRRYVKHSKAKAQEISGAIVPLARKYCENVPFQGAVLAGEFTEPARKQLESEGFNVLYIPHDKILEAYKCALGLRINWEENTPEDKLETLAETLISLSKVQRNKVIRTILRMEKKAFKAFGDGLMSVLQRRIVTISIVPLHGAEIIVKSLAAAISFLQEYKETEQSLLPFVEYLIVIRYSNDDSVKLKFRDKMSAIRALNSFA